MNDEEKDDNETLYGREPGSEPGTAPGGDDALITGHEASQADENDSLYHGQADASKESDAE